MRKLQRFVIKLYFVPKFYTCQGAGIIIQKIEVNVRAGRNADPNQIRERNAILHLELMTDLTFIAGKLLF